MADISVLQWSMDNLGRHLDFTDLLHAIKNDYFEIVHSIFSGNSEYHPSAFVVAREAAHHDQIKIFQYFMNLAILQVSVQKTMSF